MSRGRRTGQARQDEGVAEIVRLMLVSRRERENGGGNVIRLRGHLVAGLAEPEAGQ
jgi:hypothetical protein